MWGRSEMGLSGDLVLMGEHCDKLSVSVLLVSMYVGFRV